MRKQTVGYYELEGTYREIGRQLAQQPGAGQLAFPAPEAFTGKEFKEAFRLYDTWCPGIREEVEGFSEGTGIPMENIAFSWMTYLLPRCSSLILTGGKTADGHTKIARNYEYSTEAEDLKLYRTAPAGKYAHIAGSIVEFGRCEGINEKGLAVSMSSCGFPVGNMPYMRAPKMKGLQFWAVIRSLLENCAGAEEALKLVMEMPIAYNINLYLADAAGNAVLFETMDGEKAYERILPADKKQYLCGTNHIVIPEFADREPAGMRNSIVRYHALKDFAEEKEVLEEEEVRDFFLKKYPEGMTAHYYKDGFGTIKTVILDTVERRYSICWLGQKENGWTDYLLSQRQENSLEEKMYEEEQGNPEFFELVPILSEGRKEKENYPRFEKKTFAVIGKEGSSEDGEGFVARLWEKANAHFGEVVQLAIKDSAGKPVGVWGAMTNFAGTFQPWENGFSEGRYLAGVECALDTKAPEGWNKWVVPGYEYIRVECGGSDTFAEGLRYLEENGISLVGAVQDYTCPGTGKSYMLFPVRKL